MLLPLVPLAGILAFHRMVTDQLLSAPIERCIVVDETEFHDFNVDRISVPSQMYIAVYFSSSLRILILMLKTEQLIPSHRMCRVRYMHITCRITAFNVVV
jgi:hypothetical protein